MVLVSPVQLILSPFPWVLGRCQPVPAGGSAFHLDAVFCTVSDPEAHYIGTEPWKPKEALEEDGIISDKADIFAFGLTLWEMMTLSIPHLNLPGEDEVSDEGVFVEGSSWSG